MIMTNEIMKNDKLYTHQNTVLVMAKAIVLCHQHRYWLVCIISLVVNLV